ncbi:hypothetical protein BC834DRAFT_826572 [Gloeopeniophorella convolvens]|nr:hypothetical protein BC834DRAFT_826572 [Gloeopeniophorella convolvens]
MVCATQSLDDVVGSCLILKTTILSFGNQYRGCGHYVRLYSTGNRTDCGSPDCFHSGAHKHKTARSCFCSRV